MCPVTIGRWFCVGEIKMKIKIRVISELGLRIWEGELRVASGGLRVTSNQERFVVSAKSRSREGAFLPQRRRGRGGWPRRSGALQRLERPNSKRKKSLRSLRLSGKKRRIIDLGSGSDPDSRL